MERELGQVDGWGGKWRAGAGEGMSTCIKGLIVESPPPEVGRKTGLGVGWGWGRGAKEATLKGAAFRALGPPVVE